LAAPVDSIESRSEESSFRPDLPLTIRFHFCGEFMSKRKALAVISGAIAPALALASGAWADVTLNTLYSGAVPTYWPGATTADPSVVGTDPVIVSGNNGALGNPASGTVGQTVSATLVEAQTFTATTNFNLGAISLVTPGGGGNAAGNVSIHLFALNNNATTPITGASTGYVLASDQKGPDLLGGGAGLSDFSMSPTPNTEIYEFDFSGADQAALTAGVTYGIELWDSATGNTFYLNRNGGVQTYAGGQNYSALSPDGLGDDNQVTMSTVVRGAVAGATNPRDLTFAVYPAGIAIANSTWAGPGGGSWSTAGNWTNTLVPTNKGDSATFGTNIAAPSTVTLDGNHTVATITFATGNSYTIAQGTSGTLTINGGALSAAINDQTGNHTVSAPIALVAGVNLAVGAATNTLTLSGGVSGAGGITEAGNNVNQGIGTVVLGAADTYAGGTTVNSGTLIAGAAHSLPDNQPLTIAQVTYNAALTTPVVQLGTSSGVEILSALTISTGATLDINNDHVIINYTGTSPGPTYLAMLTTSKLAGWTGTGIISTAAATTPGYGIAFGDGSDHGVTWLSSGQIEISYTLNGDINQDGVVNGTDFGILAGNFGHSVTGGWEAGDLNYDGTVNGTDFGLLAGNFGKSATGRSVVLPASEWAALDSFAAAHGLLADVPEPTSASLALLAVGGLAARRRRQA
jgi:fibronectin-binding autotransporter adhesin